MANNIILEQDKQGNNVFPVTHNKAVYDSAGVSLDAKLTALESKTYIEAWDGASTPVVANIPAGIVVSYNGTNYTGTLAASSSTDGKIYLVKAGAEYDRYASTTNLAGNRVWSYLGTTTMSLDGYATRGDIEDITQDIDGTTRNFTIGFRYTSSGDDHIGGSVNYAVSDFIPVNPGDTVTWNYGSNVATTSACGFFDSNYGWLTYYAANVANKRTFTVPNANTVYLRASFHYNYTTKEIDAGSSIVVNGKVVWTPRYPSSPSAITKIATPQKLSITEKVQAQTNIGVDDAVYGSRINYVKGAYLLYDGTITASENWGFTDFIPVTPGDELMWYMGYGHVNISLGLVTYDSSHSYLGYWSGANQTDVRGPLTIGSSAAYIRVSFNLYRADGTPNISPITINGVPYILSEKVEGFMDFVKGGGLEDECRWKPLLFGELINSNTSQGELYNIGDATRVTSREKVTVPFEGVKLRFRAPNVPYRLAVYLWYGYANGTINTSTGTRMENGESVTLPGYAKAFRPVFMGTVKKSTWDVEISAQQIKDWMASGDLALEYYDVSPDDVVERNKHLSTRVDAARRVLNVVYNSRNGMGKLPVIAHISDLHGDITRFNNFMDYCDAIGGIDFAVNSGDATLYDHPDGTRWVDKISGAHRTPMLFCIGNHESWPTGQANLYADNMADLVVQQNYLIEPNTLTDHCYYYMDYDGKKLRVIVLNYYEDGVYKGRLGQTQIDWFISKLASTPTGYGVIIVLHSPEDVVVAEPPYDKFMQPSPKFGDDNTGTYVGDRPIMRIVDAFINKTTLVSSYTDHTSTYNDSDDKTTETVTINADFTGVDASTEFIAYIVGHRHEDAVGYYQHSSQRQLCLCIVCGIALFGDSYNSAWTNQCDLPRGGTGTGQDAFNIYAIDRDGGNVRMVRIGSDITVRFAYRDMQTMPYERLYGEPINFTPERRIGKTTGQLYENSNYAVSDPVSVQTGDEVTWAYGMKDTDNVFCVFFDSNNNQVTYYSAASAESRTFTPATQGISYMRACFYYDSDRGKVLPPASMSVNGITVWTPQYAPVSQ